MARDGLSVQYPVQYLCISGVPNAEAAAAISRGASHLRPGAQLAPCQLAAEASTVGAPRI